MKPYLVIIWTTENGPGVLGLDGYDTAEEAEQARDQWVRHYGQRRPDHPVTAVYALQQLARSTSEGGTEI